MAATTSAPLANFSHLRSPDFQGRLVRTLFNGRADKVPLIELGIHPQIKQAILGRPILSVEDDIEFMRSMGYDFVKIQPKIVLEVGRQKADATSDRAWSAEHGGVIQSWEDFERYQWPRPGDISYESLERAARLIPDGMGVIGQYGDIFTTAWEMMGFENFAMATYEEPELVDALMERVGGLILSMFDTMADMEHVGALWYSDDIAYTASLMMSPDFLRRSFFPFLGHIGGLARRRGIPFIYHTDGVLYEVFDDIIGAGVNAQHPIEPKAMEINEVKDRVGDRLCLCGNIDVDVLARGTPEAVRELTRRRLRELGPRGGYCLGSSNSVPDYAKVENYLAMVETALTEF